ncbi:hypothetical protein, partial [Methylosinus sp. RM1]|uniref:hypothetical protein n=1 Tax=Methylosinus sp. RM1 TaxID=2583817 RepID=UPI001A9C6FAE
MTRYAGARGFPWLGADFLAGPPRRIVARRQPAEALGSSFSSGSAGSAGAGSAVGRRAAGRRCT